MYEYLLVQTIACFNLFVKLGTRICVLLRGVVTMGPCSRKIKAFVNCTMWVVYKPYFGISSLRIRYPYVWMASFFLRDRFILYSNKLEVPQYYIKTFNDNFFQGVSGFLWWLIWFTFVTNDPASDKWISKKELAYIKDNQVQTKRPKNVSFSNNSHFLLRFILLPYFQVMAIWKGILTSKCIWVLCFCKFVTAVGSSFGVTCFPTYIKG